jgi:hypothetical protein
MLSLLGDAVVAVLLIATIGYAAVLNRRLQGVRSDRAKFEQLVKGLTQSTQRAEGAVAGLRATTEDLARRLDKKIEEGQGLLDDLGYMIERGTSVADRLENGIRIRRDELKPDLNAGAKAASRGDHAVEPVIRAAAGRAEPRPRIEPQPPLPTVEIPATRRAAAPSRAERELLRALSGRR